MSMNNLGDYYTIKDLRQWIVTRSVFCCKLEVIVILSFMVSSEIFRNLPRIFQLVLTVEKSFIGLFKLITFIIKGGSA